MKVLLGCLLVFLSVGGGSSDLAGECDMVAFYQELGCTATADAGVAAKDGPDCPRFFQCPDLHPNASMCYYKGKPYADRQSIPQGLVKEPCSQVCQCRVSSAGPEFQCAAVDCVEFFDGSNDECIQTFDLEHCCSVGKVCGKDAIAKMSTCEVDGKSYKEGEYFKPKNTIKNCVCTPKWNGSIENQEYCRDISCGLEIHYQDRIFQKCAPIFYKVGSCPIGFQCPTPDMKLRKGINVRGVNAVCTFGNETLTAGDAYDFADCTRCECLVPPFLSCSKLTPSKCQTSKS